MGLTGSRDVTEEEPWCLVPSQLETWYNENIQLGTANFDDDCRRAVDNVVRNVHRLCSKNDLLFNVDRVVKGGSLGKGTMVKDLSDVDLVAFINPPYLKPVATLGKELYKETLSSIISDLETALSRLHNVTEIDSDIYVVKFKINVGQRCLKVDLLPTTDNIQVHGNSYSRMFRDMLEIGHAGRQFYSASLVKRQLAFVKEQPSYVKELIRLVKYWANKFLPEYLQKSYPLELITIHLWEEAGMPGPRRLSKAQGLKSVLKVLTNLEELCVYWQYGHDDVELGELVISRLRMKSPIVLDPANPTNNVCYCYQLRNNMSVIADAAEKTLQTELLKRITVCPSWRE